MTGALDTWWLCRGGPFCGVAGLGSTWWPSWSQANQNQTSAGERMVYDTGRQGKTSSAPSNPSTGFDPGGFLEAAQPVLVLEQRQGPLTPWPGVGLPCQPSCFGRVRQLPDHGDAVAVIYVDRPCRRRLVCLWIWESQLLETGLSGYLPVPGYVSARPFPRTPPPVLVLWLYRWLGFRIMLGSGLIKLRGDECWRTLTCLDYHFETQPIPNPISRWLHFLPHPASCTRACYGITLSNWSCRGFSSPSRWRHGAALLAISFQVFLIVSGNLSFLNWLTIIPFLACIDDSLWRRCLPTTLVRRAEQAAETSRPCRGQRQVSYTVAVLVAVLSIQPVANLLSSRQAMNTSFDPWEIVNTYGAFGSVGQERREIVVEGSADGPNVEGVSAFKAKPGDPQRRPPFISPYHLRLDWLMWFAAMGEPQDYPWTLNLVWKLLHNDRASTPSLLAGNPFPQAPPTWVRMQLYGYQFAPGGNPCGPVVEPTLLGDGFPPCRRTTLACSKPCRPTAGLSPRDGRRRASV